MRPKPKPAFGQVWAYDAANLGVSRMLLLRRENDHGMWQVAWIYGDNSINVGTMYGLHDDPAKIIPGYEFIGGDE